MLKKLSQFIGLFLLLIFSFFYTKKSIDIIREKDPLMKKIKSNSLKYNIDSKDAEIKNNKIIPGKTGKKIDYQKTYEKMKQYGAYNEVFFTIKETNPNISINNYYDKYIISGNKDNKVVALIFKINNYNYKDIIKILNETKTKATFFIDGKYIEDNYQEIKNNSNFEIELLNYDNDYNELSFISSKSYLESLTNKKCKYCYTEKENDKLLNICKKEKLHTIIPTIIVKNKPYIEIKEKLSNGAIISLPINNQTKKELRVVISYIKARGYKIVFLNKLLNEN